MDLKKINYLLITIFVLGISACASNQKHGDPTNNTTIASMAESGNIAGTWDGLIQNGIDFHYIRFELSPNSSSSMSKLYLSPTGSPSDSVYYQGKAYAQPLRDYLNGDSLKNHINTESVPIKVVFNPRLNTFSVTADTQSQRRQRRTNSIADKLRGMSGVYDTHNKALAGLINSRGYAIRSSKPALGNQYFVLTTPDQFEEIAETYERLGARRMRAASKLTAMAGLFGLSGAPGKSEIKNWARKLYAEYPDLDLYHSRYGQLELVAIKLFRDEYFEKHFGSTFNELSKTTLDGFRMNLQKLRNSKDRHERSTSVLERMFWVGQGDNSAKQTVLWAKAQNYFAGWRKQQITILQRLPPNKKSLDYIDGLEKEIEKIAETVFWPSEIASDRQGIQTVRNQLAYPVLNSMLAEYQNAPPSLQLMNRLANWTTNEKRLFSYIDTAQSQTLRKSAERKLNSIISALIPEYEEKISLLSTGLRAVINGNAWYAGLMRDFDSVKYHEQVLKVHRKFFQQRSTHLADAEAEMISRLKVPYQALPKHQAPSSDSKYLSYCSTLNQLKNEWLALPGDQDNLSSKNVLATMSRLGGRVTSLLPPRQRSKTGFKPIRDRSKVDQQIAGYRKRVDPIIMRTGSLSNNDITLKTTYPKPLHDAGFEFNSNVVWALFHGRFDELNSRLYKEGGLSSKVIGSFNINPQFHHAFVTFVGLSSLKHAKNQIGPTTILSWSTTVEDQWGNKEVTRKGWGKVYIPQVLAPHYEKSYKLAEGSSGLDRLYGKNGLAFLETIAKQGLTGFVSSAKVRPDGEFQLLTASWEQPVVDDLANILKVWPQQSYGLWQLQENMVRYLENRPSIQAVTGYR